MAEDLPHREQLRFARRIRFGGCLRFAQRGIFGGELDRGVAAEQHAAQLPALCARFIRKGKRIIVRLNLRLNAAEPHPEYARIIGDQVPAGGAAIAVSAILKLQRRRTDAILAKHGFVSRLGFGLAPAAGGHDVEPPACDEIARKQFLRHAVNDGFFDDPRPTFGQGKGIEPLWRDDGAGGHLEGPAKRRQKRIDLRYD
ncbi:hypothetical protein SDC9_166798 [bioreactor metagenome]|uniref:Uncharacterized protein n=1 Tax=bioreactor metagenome TaxID=1076179 RepID=A0A645G0N3_9ZZZZ